MTVFGASVCELCTARRTVRTPKGSTFLLCERSQTDPRYPKYPPQPVVRCPGFEPRPADGAGPR